MVINIWEKNTSINQRKRNVASWLRIWETRILHRLLTHREEEEEKKTKFEDSKKKNAWREEELREETWEISASTNWSIGKNKGRHFDDYSEGKCIGTRKTVTNRSIPQEKGRYVWDSKKKNTLEEEELREQTWENLLPSIEAFGRIREDFSTLIHKENALGHGKS